MRFLLDAQLPVRLARALSHVGHDVVHTSDLPRGNASTDGEVCEVADEHERVVVTKDRDFRDSHLLRGTPRQLRIVATGNMSNADLLALFEVHGSPVVTALLEADFVELGPDALLQHRRLHAPTAGPRAAQRPLTFVSGSLPRGTMCPGVTGCRWPLSAVGPCRVAMCLARRGLLTPCLSSGPARRAWRKASGQGRYACLS